MVLPEPSGPTRRKGWRKSWSQGMIQSWVSCTSAVPTMGRLASEPRLEMFD